SLGHSGSPINGRSRRCRLGYVISCVQSQLITWDMYTDHQSTDQCALMISVAPAVPPVSVHQCQLSVLISASARQCHISGPTSAHQCHISGPISELPFSATYQCQSVPPISAIYQCCLSVAISDACQCPSV
ncbi:unnamed protein product, partial [Staurois parvus]